MMEEMEHIWVDNDETNLNAFVKSVCTRLNYVLGSSNRGEQTFTQRIRFAFHDFSTPDTATGTGCRVGCKCGGSSSGIKLHVGRIDATSAGPARVPGPATDLNTTLAQFVAAGFHASETISPTACEHSLGRVHNSDNPNAFNSSFATATNLDGAEPFDSTPGVWDPNNINEYLKGTGSREGPLCIAENVADRSDYRVVSSTVTFSNTVKLMEWKAVDVMMDISLFGDASISGLIRNLHRTTQPPKTVSYCTASSTGISSTGTSSDLSGTGTSIFGSTICWPFNNTIAPGTTSLSFNNVPYPVNGNIFVLPAQSSFDSSSGSIIVKSATSGSSSRIVKSTTFAS
ncbi:hypothetical protein BHYA_0313g00020 [Botrytis hyacinthi]|uniref:Peroxidase n=1 Tax=Botrytis hyacinthi TaxID=278943 RepID=A0A4Z1GAK0_9HELO|nr:hypothetical protein BHYA_0313g00020 [Botrytis hyacinthi]